MGLFANAFTWWTDASWGTRFLTRRHGREVGKDEFGNVYFQHKDEPRRRWVIYDGSNDSSRVPPGWNAWLRGTIDALPSEALPKRRPFEAEPKPNLTGTSEAWRPQGSLGSGGRRPMATGDYQPWIPE